LNSLLARSFYNRGLRGTIYSSDGVKLAWSERIPTLVLKKYTAEDEKQLRKYIDDSQIAVLKNSGSVEVTWGTGVLFCKARAIK